MKMILKCISASAIFFCFASIVFDGPVLTMQSDLNMNADPFIPQQQQQRQRQPEHVQANSYSVHQHPQIQPIRQNYRNLPSPPQIHSPKLSASPVMSPLLPIHYDSNLREEHGEHEEESYEFDDLMKHVVDFVVGSEEKGTSGSGHIGEEDWRSMNSYAPSDDHNSLQQLTPLLQTITSPVSKIPASITGSNPVPIQSPLTKTIPHTSSSFSHEIEPSAVKEANTDKITFGTVDENMVKAVPEKPKSRGPPPGFPAKNPSKTKSPKKETADTSAVNETLKYLEDMKKSTSPTSKNSSPPRETQKSSPEIGTYKQETIEASPLKEVTKYMEVMKKPLTSSRNNSPPKEAQIKPKSHNLAENIKSNLAKVNEKTPIASLSIVGQPATVNLPKSEQKLAVSPPKPEMISSDHNSPGFKQKETKIDKGEPKVNNNQGFPEKVNPDWTCKHDKGIEIEYVNIGPKTDGNPSSTARKGSRNRRRKKEENPQLNEFIAQAEMARKAANSKGKPKASKSEAKPSNQESGQSKMQLDSIEMVKDEENPIDHNNEIKTLLSILKYEEIMRIAQKLYNNEELIRKDIRYLLFAIQLFYDSFTKYWHKNYKFHDTQIFAYIGDVLTKISQFYTSNGTIEKNMKLPKQTEESLEKCMHILAEIWTVPKYKEIMVAEQYKNEKYNFIIWMEALEQLFEPLKSFYKRIKHFNRMDARKKELLDKLIPIFSKNILSYYDTMLKLKFRTIFGIVFIGFDKQDNKLLSKRKLLTGLNYLKNWLPGRKLELTHARKVMWHYFEIESYLWEKQIRADMGKGFEKILALPMPEGNYIEINDYVHDAVKTAIEFVDALQQTNSEGKIVFKISPEVEAALDVFKEHILCDNFLLTMYRKIIQSQNEVNLANKHNVHMLVNRRIFWKIVDTDRCIPAEENYNKILEMPEYQEFLKSNYSFNNIMDDALKALENLKLNYNFEARRTEAREECDCCKPEEGYDKDSEEEKGRS